MSRLRTATAFVVRAAVLTVAAFLLGMAFAADSLLTGILLALLLAAICLLVLLILGSATRIEAADPLEYVAPEPEEGPTCS